MNAMNQSHLARPIPEPRPSKTTDVCFVLRLCNSICELVLSSLAP
ncbi:mCG140165 [Mus musculus]|nr:mCG140165 [Mus musculus]